MSKTVDERVVSMRFDNENFERNAQQSLSTLEKLKNALSFKGAADGLKNVDAASRSVNMSGLAAGVETVNARFSALEVIGVTALARITNQAMAAGEQLVKSLSIDQITAGWSKYAEKTTAVQTIMAATSSAYSDTEEQMAAVNAQLEKLSWFTDETSYNFVDMVSNIGKFTSNNIGLETSVTAMQGIANWAAISGANATEASRAMYNLSQAIGVGAVTAIDWKSIENANMATAEFKQTAIDTAVALGKLKQNADGTFETFEGNAVSVANFREALSDKWFTNDVLTQTLDKYGAFTDKLNAAFNETGKLTSELLEDIEAYKDGTLDLDKAVEGAEVTAERYGQLMSELGDKSMEFGMKTFKAAQETKTFAEVIDYTKDAVSSNWMNIFESIFGDYTQAKKFWTGMSEDFYTLFVEPLENLGSIVEDAFGSKWDTLTKKITDAGLSMSDFEEAVKQAMGMGDLQWKHAIENYGSFQALIESGKIGNGVLKNALQSLVDKAKDVTGATQTVTKSIVDLESVVNRVIRGDFGNGQSRIEALAQAGYDFATVQDLVNKTMAGQVVDYKQLIEVQAESGELTEEQIAKLKSLCDEEGNLSEETLKLLGLVQRKSGRELFTESIQNGIQILIRSIGILKGAWGEVFNYDRAELLYTILDRIHAFSEGALNRLDANADAITRTFKGLFSVLDLIVKTIKAPFRLAFNVANKVLSKFNLSVWDITAAIGDWLTNIHDVILGNVEANGILETIVGTIARFIGILIEFGKKVGIVEKAQKIFSKFGDIVATVRKTVSDFFGKAGTKFGEFIDRWKDIDKIDLETFKAMLKDLKENFIDVLFDFDLEEIKQKVADAGSAVVGGFGLAFENIKTSPIASAFSRLFGGVQDYIKNGLDWGDIIAGTFAGIDVYAVLKIVKLLGSVSDLAGAAEKMMAAVTGAFSSVKGFLKGIVRSINIRLIINIALAMAILAASLVALAIAFQKIGKEDMTAALDALAKMAAILAGLALAVGVMNKLSSGLNGGIGVGGVILALAASLLLITKALKNMESLDASRVAQNMHALEEMLFAFAAVVVALIAVSAGLKKAGLDGKLQVGGALFGILALAAALYITVKSLIKIQNKLSGFKFKDFAGVFLGIFVALASVAAAAIPFMLGGAGMGFGLLAAVGALYVLISAIEKIADFDVSKVTKNISAFIAVFVMLRVLMSMTRFAGANGSAGGAAVVQMAAALLIIAIAMKQIADMDQAGLEKALKVVSILMAIMGGVMALTKFAGPDAAKAGMALIMMSVAIGIVVGIMYLLALLASNDPEGFNKALFAVTAIGLIFAAIIKAGSSFRASGGLLKTIALALTVIVALAGILYALGTFKDPSALMNAALALTLVSGVFAVLMLVAKFTTVTPAAMTAVGSLVLVMAGLAAVLVMTAELAPESVLPVAEALSLLLAALSTSLVLLSFVGAAAGPALAGIGVLVAAIVAIGGLMAAIGALMSGSSRLEEFVSNALPMLELIGEGIGRFIGGIIGGIGIATMHAFAQMGEIFNVAVAAWTPGLNALSNMDDGAIEGAKMIAETMLILAGASIVEKLATFLHLGKNPLAAFGDFVKEFAGSLVGFPKLSPTDSSAALMAAAVGKQFAEIASSIPRTGGIFQKIFGEKDLAAFGKQLKSLGKSIKGFPAVSPDDASNAINAAQAASEFLTIAGSIPSNSGLLQKVFGGQDLGVFGTQIRTLAESVSAFPAVSDDDKTNAIAAAEIGVKMSELASQAPDTNGLWQKIFGGGTDLSTFGKSIWSFAASLATIPNLPEGTADTLAALVGCVRSATAIANAVSTSESQIATASVSTFLNNGNSGFVARLKSVIPKFTGLADEINKVDWSNTNASIEKMRSTVATLSEIISSATSSDGENLASMTESFKSFAKNGLAAFAEGFAEDDGTIASGIEEMIAVALKAFSEQQGKFKSAGKDLIAKVRAGVAGYSTATFKAAFTSKLSAAVTAIRNYYYQFSSAGSYLGDGLVSGINSKQQEVYQAGFNLGKKSLEGYEAATDENSPSKEARDRGRYFGEGLVNGMNDYADAVYATASSIGENSITAVTASLSAIDDAINSGVDFTPTITPVLDTTSVSYGLGEISSAISGAKAMALSTSISGEMDANGVVLDYIDKLDKANSDRNGVLLKALDNVRNEIGRLGDRIDQIDMVLDSGELVGAIGPKVDKDAGRKTRFKRRGM